MKTARKLLFPFLLIASSCIVWFWQNSVASLPYLPNNCIVPLGIMTPLLLITVFFTTLVMEKQSESPRPVLHSFISTGAMLLPIIATGVFFLSFVSYRYAGILPVLVLPNWPTGIVTAIITLFCIMHLTGLLICRLVKQKYKPNRFIPALIGWIAMNICLFFVTI
ncbi:MAG: hypothetical protein K6F09_07365 [Clostridiales bacterium]|nr:hypothetical protein [Clostridiales bacterium]